jgi:putative oxygen-independent coproporphyrinogen III oxidase
MDKDLFGIYVHWPFCLSKCPYCDFNSHVRESVDQDRWLKAYVTEIKQLADLTPTRRATSIFFGGGTPSLMPAKTTAAIIDAIDQAFGIAPGAEITLEANPTSVEADKFKGFAAAGVNRVSLGIQSLNDDQLKFLGRQHSANEAIAALELAQSLFDRVTFDLIYARPDQTADQWRDELNRALSFGTDHMSLYQLTIEPNTAFEKLYKRKEIHLLNDDLAADLFDLTTQITDTTGLHRYETSNHAKPGQESLHNLTYWRHQPYIGIGPGAHGRVVTGNGLNATVMARTPEDWLRQVETVGHGLIENTDLDLVTQGEEMLMMGLRLNEGVSLARFESLWGKPLDNNALDDLRGEGLIDLSASRIAVTAKGTAVLNGILGHLLT